MADGPIAAIVTDQAASKKVINTIEQDVFGQGTRAC
jgi:hypothetical protein